MSKRKFFVIEANNVTSWNDKTEQGEAFATLDAAKKRATALAGQLPGEEILICEVCAAVTAPVGKPEFVPVKRRSP